MGVDECGLLSTLARLRDDMVQDDYRARNLGWLKAMSSTSGIYQEDKDDPDSFLNDLEASLPAGRKQLTPPLNRFADFSEIDPFLIAAASERSPDLNPLQQSDLAPLISRLTRQDCDEFLLKIITAAQGAIKASQTGQHAGRRARTKSPDLRRIRCGGRVCSADCQPSFRGGRNRSVQRREL
jgi:hypothetical protein